MLFRLVFSVVPVTKHEVLSIHISDFFLNVGYFGSSPVVKWVRNLPLSLRHCHCSSLVIAVVGVPSLAWELPHDSGVTERKGQRKEGRKITAKSKVMNLSSCFFLRVL